MRFAAFPSCKCHLSKGRVKIRTFLHYISYIRCPLSFARAEVSISCQYARRVNARLRCLDETSLNGFIENGTGISKPS